MNKQEYDIFLEGKLKEIEYFVKNHTDGGRKYSEQNVCEMLLEVDKRLDEIKEAYNQISKEAGK